MFYLQMWHYVTYFWQTLPPVNYMLQVFYNYLDMRDFDTSSNIQNTCIINLSAFWTQNNKFWCWTEINIDCNFLQVFMNPYLFYAHAPNCSNIEILCSIFTSKKNPKINIWNLKNISTLLLIIRKTRHVAFYVNPAYYLHRKFKMWLITYHDLTINNVLNSAK